MDHVGIDLGSLDSQVWVRTETAEIVEEATPCDHFYALFGGQPRGNKGNSGETEGARAQAHGTSLLMFFVPS
jgi:hypothetical protein